MHGIRGQWSFRRHSKHFMLNTFISTPLIPYRSLKTLPFKQLTSKSEINRRLQSAKVCPSRKTQPPFLSMKLHHFRQALVKPQAQAKRVSRKRKIPQKHLVLCQKSPSAIPLSRVREAFEVKNPITKYLIRFSF